MITIERWCYGPTGVFGTLTYGDFSCYTVERPWVDNTPRQSCIPDGEYVATWYQSPRFGRTLALTGETVSLFPTPGFARSAILIHSANTMDDLLGCIGLGSSLGMVKGKWAVLNSVVTTRALLSMVPSTGTKIIISPSLATTYSNNGT